MLVCYGNGPDVSDTERVDEDVQQCSQVIKHMGRQ